MNQHKIIAIVLAAGMGRRFDASGEQNKLFQSLKDGRSVIQNTIQHVLDAGLEVVVVLRSADQAVQLSALFPLSALQFLTCANASTGMAHSLATAMTHLPPDVTGALIALGDMPSLQATTISAVANALQSGAEIVVPCYRDQRGHPVGFARRHFAELMRLQGDQGARRLLQTYPVLELVVDDPGVVLDIDTIEDLQRLRATTKDENASF